MCLMRFSAEFTDCTTSQTGYLSDILSHIQDCLLWDCNGKHCGGNKPDCRNAAEHGLKAVMLIVVGIADMANLGINLLGAYVHAWTDFSLWSYFQNFMRAAAEPLSR